MAFRERIEVLLDVQTTKFKSAMSGIRTDMAQATTSFGKFQAGAKGAFGLANQYAAQLALAGGAALVTFGVKSVKAFQDTALAAKKFSDTTGVGIEAASRWREVAGDLDVDAGIVEGSLNKLNIAVSKTPEKFAAAGVEIARLDNGALDVNKTFLNLIDRLDKTSDTAERNRIAAELLGKGWTGMSELVAKGADGLAESLAAVSDAKVIDEAEVAKAEKTRERLDALKDTVEDLTLKFGEAASSLVPYITKLGEIVEFADELIGFGDGAGGVERFGEAAEAATPNINELLRSFEGVALASIEARDPLDKVSSIIGGFADSDMPVNERLRALQETFASIAKTSPNDADSLLAAFDAVVKSAAFGDEAAQSFAKHWGITRYVVADLRGVLDRARTGIDDVTEATDAETAATEAAEAAIGAVKAARIQYAAVIDEELQAEQAAMDAINLAKQARVQYGLVIEDTADAVAEAAEAEQKITDALEDTASVLERVRDLEQKRRDDALDAIDTQEGFIASMRDLRDAQAEYDELLADTETTTAEADAATFDLGESYRQLAKESAKAAGAADGSTESIDKQIESLYNVASVLDPSSPLRVQLLRYIADLQRVPTDVVTNFRTTGVGGDILGKGIPGEKRFTSSAPGPGFVGTRFTSDTSTVPLGTVGEVGPAAVLEVLDEIEDRTAEIKAAQFEFGEITLDEYRTYLQGRKDATVAWSDEWISLRRAIAQLDEQEAAAEKARIADLDAARKAAIEAELARVAEAKAAKDMVYADEAQRQADAIEAEDALQKHLYDSGAISLEQYKAYLASRQSTLAVHSVEWIDLWNQIATLEATALANQQATADRNREADLEALEAHHKAVEEAEKAHLERLAREITLAKARQELADAAEEAEAAVAAVGLAKPEDMAAAQKRAAEALARRADAALNAAGVVDDTADWLAGMRASLEADKANAPALAAAIDRLLLGIASPGAGGLTVNQTINAGLGVDPTKIERAALSGLMSAIRDYERGKS